MPLTGSVNQPPRPDPELDLEAGRVAVQACLGQVHGLLHRAVLGENGRSEPAIQAWCPPEAMDEIRNAYEHIGPAFGHVQDQLNTGAHDATLVDLGLAGTQFEPKRMGLLRALRRLGRGFIRAPFKTALRWSATIVGSLSREIPGGDVIGEFIQVVQNAMDELGEATTSD